MLAINKRIEEWGDSFGDEVTAASLIDRLLNHCHIVNIRGNSYRMREHRALASRLVSAPRPSQRPGQGSASCGARRTGHLPG